MKSGNVDGDSAPSRDREHGCLAGFVSNHERGVLGTVLRNIKYLGSSPTIIYYSDFGVCVTTTYHREHPQRFV